ncbi:MAG: hypothetical protein DCF25_20925 [Leptolyngbya foveolarum]|uniref:DUF2811 domain-containing protein n=1 Tax=Leptolyngbya foveolarum TaxID=47253 RepID=A0A2W4TM02_9CYAN|nr:MAG: hypothetical protein DCF25_20925 [Leptolyngbya foveolarum]
MFILPTSELPAPLRQHLDAFAAQRPGWTAERVLSNALSLFLLQNGVQDRAVSQLYLQSTFGELFAPTSNDAKGELS